MSRRPKFVSVDEGSHKLEIVPQTGDKGTAPFNLLHLAPDLQEYLLFLQPISQRREIEDRDEQRVTTNTTPCRVTCIDFIFSVGGCGGCGSRYRAARSVAEYRWSGSRWSSGGFQFLAFCIRIRWNALTPRIRGGSRMRESRSYGFVRGCWVTSVPTATPEDLRMCV